MPTPDQVIRIWSHSHHNPLVENSSATYQVDAIFTSCRVHGTIDERVMVASIKEMFTNEGQPADRTVLLIWDWEVMDTENNDFGYPLLIQYRTDSDEAARAIATGFGMRKAYEKPPVARHHVERSNPT